MSYSSRFLLRLTKCSSSFYTVIFISYPQLIYYFKDQLVLQSYSHQWKAQAGLEQVNVLYKQSFSFVPPSLSLFFNTQKANMSNFKFQLGFNACNCVKKILKLSDNMYSNKLSSVFYEFIFFNKSLFTNYHFNRDW